MHLPRTTPSTTITNPSFFGTLTENVEGLDGGSGLNHTRRPHGVLEFSMYGSSTKSLLSNPRRSLDVHAPLLLHNDNEEKDVLPRNTLTVTGNKQGEGGGVGGSESASSQAAESTFGRILWSRPRGGGAPATIPTTTAPISTTTMGNSASNGLTNVNILTSPSSSLETHRAPEYDFRVVLSSGKTSTLPIVLSVGSGCVQGARVTMEDEHFIALNRAVVHENPVSLFGVLDGHCGRRVAELGSKWLPEFFFSHSALGDNNALAMVESILLSDRAIYKMLCQVQSRERAPSRGRKGDGNSHSDDTAKPFLNRKARKGELDANETTFERLDRIGSSGSLADEDSGLFSSSNEISAASGGSTLIAAAVHGRMLYVACLGDARAVLYDGHTTIAMSEDHKPSNPKESRRIARCGGFVQFGRVCGILAVSRALGDFEFKMNNNNPLGADTSEEIGHLRRTDFSLSSSSSSTLIASKRRDRPKNTSHPEYAVSNIADVRQLNLTDNSTFLILACDGLWDVLLNEEATQFVKDFLTYTPDISDPLIQCGRKPKPSEHVIARALNNCCKKLAEFAVDRGSTDNVSVMLLFFHDVVDSVANFSRAPAVACARSTHISSSEGIHARLRDSNRSLSIGKDAKVVKSSVPLGVPPTIRRRRHIMSNFENSKKKLVQRGGER